MIPIFCSQSTSTYITLGAHAPSCTTHAHADTRMNSPRSPDRLVPAFHRRIAGATSGLLEHGQFTLLITSESIGGGRISRVLSSFFERTF